MEKATLAGGCFWCTEAIFSELKGVSKVESGYTGGEMNNPKYEQVGSGVTNHAEAVQITFNPNLISYEKLVEIFFKTHDPTSMNRQGNDVGRQYRSEIFYHNDKQKKVVEKVKQQINDEKIYKNPIVTVISPYKKFFRAEDYHQDYYEKNKNKPYCQIVINPKLAKFRKEYKKYLK